MESDRWHSIGQKLITAHETGRSNRSAAIKASVLHLSSRNRDRDMRLYNSDHRADDSIENCIRPMKQESSRRAVPRTWRDQNSDLKRVAIGPTSRPTGGAI